MRKDAPFVLTRQFMEKRRLPSLSTFGYFLTQEIDVRIYLSIGRHKCNLQARFLCSIDSGLRPIDVIPVDNCAPGAGTGKVRLVMQL